MGNEKENTCYHCGGTGVEWVSSEDERCLEHPEPCPRCNRAEKDNDSSDNKDD